MNLALVSLLLIAAAPPQVGPPESPRHTPVVDVVRNAGPAVVNISTQTRAQANPFARSVPDAFFERFFSRSPRRRDRQQSLGSGVIIDEGGLVLTNEHVISRATDITITLADRRTFEVDLVGADPAFDIAVLKVRNAERLPSVEIGSSSGLMPGETVVAIGNPFGLSNSVTTGVVSALHRSIEADEKNYEDFIQTDAAINPGNSGGALLDITGRLIGINTAIYNQANGIGFAIPVDQAMAVVDEVLQYGEVRSAFTGLYVSADAVGGATIDAVLANSPGARARLRPGDRIIDVSGQEVSSGRAFQKVERSLIPGRTVRLTVLRGDRRLTIDLTADELDRELALDVGQQRLGLSVKVDGRGLVIDRVDPRSHAARLGIKRGHRLLAAGNLRLRTRDDIEKVYEFAFHARAVSVVIGHRGGAARVNLELAVPRG